MTVRRYSLPLVDGFTVIPTERVGTVLYDQAAGQVRAPATWVENLLAGQSGQLYGLREFQTGVGKVPEPVISTVSADNQLNSATVSSPTGQTGWAVWTANAVAIWNGATWHTILTKNSLIPIDIIGLKGTTYFFASDLGLYRYAETSFAMREIERVHLAGVQETRLGGIASAVGYLITWDTTRVYWSSPFNSLNFVPDLLGDDAGAGSTQVLALQGSIQTVRPAPDGFYIYSTINIVQAKYTQNPENPWSFTEVVNSAGVYDASNLTPIDNGSSVVGVSGSGMFTLTDGRLSYDFADISAFLLGTDYPSWNTETLSTQIQQVSRRPYRLRLLGNRFLSVSFGTDYNSQYCLLMDTANRNWSRLNYPHLLITGVSAQLSGLLLFEDWLVNFEDEDRTFWDLLSFEAVNRAGSFLMVQPDGTITLLAPHVESDFDRVGKLLPSVLYYGNVGLERNREFTVTEVTCYGTGLVDLAGNSDTGVYPEEPQVYVAPINAIATTATKYLSLSYTDTNQATFVNRVRSPRVKVAVLNAGTLETLELAVVLQGMRDGYRNTN